MKIKQDFITNSSSTSYIVGVNNKDENPICSEFNLTDQSLVIDNIEKLNIYFYNEGYDLKKLYKYPFYVNSKNIIDNGGRIFIFRERNCGTVFEEFIYKVGFKNLIFSSNTIIIRGE